MADLVTLQEVKDYLGLRSPDKDEKLKMLIGVVSSDVENRKCRRRFLKQTYTEEKYDGGGTNELVLRNCPVVSIAELIPWKYASALTEDTDFVVEADRGIVRLLYMVFPVSILGISVTYDAGYDGISSLPEDLRFAVIQAVAHKYHESSMKTYAVKRQSKGEEASEYIETEYPQHALEIFALHSRKAVG